MPDVNARKAQKATQLQAQAQAQGPKTVPSGYRNYGQYRSEQVHQRNAARKATQTGLTSYKRKSKTKPRFGANQSVDNATYNRTLKRLDRLNVIPKGLEGDNITGADARRAKRLLNKQRDAKTRYSI